MRRRCSSPQFHCPMSLFTRIASSLGINSASLFWCCWRLRPGRAHRLGCRRRSPRHHCPGRCRSAAIGAHRRAAPGRRPQRGDDAHREHALYPDDNHRGRRRMSRAAQTSGGKAPELEQHRRAAWRRRHRLPFAVERAQEVLFPEVLDEALREGAPDIYVSHFLHGPVSARPEVLVTRPLYRLQGPRPASST